MTSTVASPKPTNMGKDAMGVKLYLHLALVEQQKMMAGW